MANKVRYGLKKAYYATVTMSGSTPTFGTPVAMPGAVSIALEPQGDSSEMYADDETFFDQESNQGYNGTLTVAMIPESFETDCLGAQKDNDNLIVETAEDTASYFALLFEFTGDKKAIRHCLYYCKASRIKQEGETKGETIEVKTEDLEFKARPIPGTKTVKVKTSETTDSERYDAWYTTVALPDFPELTVSPESATWDGENDVVLTVTGGTVDSIKLNGSAVNSSNYTVSTSTVTIKATYLSTLTAGVKRFKLFVGADKNAVYQLTIPSTT